MNSMNDRNTEGAEGTAAAPATTRSGVVLRVLLALAILGTSAAVALYWLTHRPKPPRRAPEALAALVEVLRVAPAREQVTIRAMGTVRPAHSADLAARVSGEIVEVNPEFVPGGRFGKGARILSVERSDYELAVRQRAADLTRAQGDLALEMGQQDVARREYELLGRDLDDADRALLLRQPQLAKAKAAVSAAEAALDDAQLDLRRTDVTAPFHAVVQTRNADLGSQVNAGAALATLVGTDEYWIETAVPVDELRWIRFPDEGAGPGSAARICHESAWGRGAFRTGVVVRLMADLEPEGRMARLLVGVPDPLDLKSPSAARRPLLIGSFVRVEIAGRELVSVVRLPRSVLRDGNRVWVMDGKGTLEIREVGLAWTGDEYVYVNEGLADGDLVVTSDLAAPVPGMALRTSGSEHVREGGRPGEQR